MKKCPFCAEEIQDEAIKCKHCGEMLEKQPPIRQNKIEETIIKEMHPTLRSYRLLWLIGFLFLIIGISPLFLELKSLSIPNILIGLFFIIVIFIHSDSILYTITNKRIKTKRGIFSNRTDEIDIEHIRNISLRQSFDAQMFGYGDVLISTAGMSGYEIIFKNILHPQEIMTLIKDLQSGTYKDF